MTPSSHSLLLLKNELGGGYDELEYNVVVVGGNELGYDKVRITK